MSRDSDSNIDIEGADVVEIQLDKILKDLRKLVDLVKGESRVKIFYYLLIYKELSLSRLSELMRKPKTTVYHHVDLMLKENLLKKEKRKKDVFYSFSDIIIQMFRGDSGTVRSSDAKDMKPEEQLEMANLLNATMKAVFLIIRNTIDLSEEFIDKQLEKKSFLDLTEDTPLGIGVMPLTEDDHEFYEKGLNDLIKQLIERRKSRKKEQEVHDTPFLSIMMLVPVREILQTLLSPENQD